MTINISGCALSDTVYEPVEELLSDTTTLTVVGVVHDLNLAARFADTILLLNHGRVPASGASEEVLSAQHFTQAFHGTCDPPDRQGTACTVLTYVSYTY